MSYTVKELLNEVVSPELAHKILTMHNIKPGADYFSSDAETVNKVYRDGKRLGIKHNSTSRASGKSESRHVWDRMNSLALKYVQNKG